MVPLKVTVTQIKKEFSVFMIKIRSMAVLEEDII